VATAPSPGGKYIASFSARIINGTGSSAGASVSCSFQGGVGNSDTFESGASSDEILTIVGGVEVSGFATGLNVVCEDNNSAGTQTVRGPRLVMVRVGTLTAGS
jgi:hypothetical protein